MISTTVCFVIYAFSLSSPVPDVDVLETGNPFPQIDSYTVGNHTGLVFVALSPGCRYCKQSYPFYEALIAMRDQEKPDLPVIAAIDTSGNMRLQSFLLEEAGVHFDSLIALPFHPLKVHYVPMVIHLDNQGRIVKVWEGQLSEEGESEVLSALFQGI
ncbi:MAG: hypothetical protein OXI05_00105 [Bacteroidota bacterium]|nr:hypothetical protein [Bacteroidota bacterium]MXW14209.1 hypothetical protein [Rhodothermaceae bacterium]MDE2644228.1 hypothetical protein [Bacteroidota bacterium]MYC03231.1 hypothetical protein [Rhodothermaceae bacterium]MYI16154.1 hypothetical protein [Rhodothermaceae bacterium]